ncbi:MAG: hypothetical protein H6868_02900 [Rhodospirillales bacterium]|nr:hypothetical protein [Rhodospirillales bacterium]
MDYSKHVTASRYEGTRYVTVNSYVDAQNSFGAMLRMPYMCKSKYSNGEWELIDFKMN